MSIILSLIEAFASWEVVAIIAIICLRKPIALLMERLVSGQSGRAKIGPIEFELGKLAEDGREAIDRLNRIHLIVAESRLLELEITKTHFSHSFSDKQNKKLAEIIKNLEKNMKESRA